MCPRDCLGLCPSQIVPTFCTLAPRDPGVALRAYGSSVHIPIFLGGTSGLSCLTSLLSPDPVSVLLGSESAVRSKVLKQEPVFKAAALTPLTSAPWVNAGSPPDTGSPRRHLCSLSLWIYSNPNSPCRLPPAVVKLQVWRYSGRRKEVCEEQ